MDDERKKEGGGGHPHYMIPTMCSWREGTHCHCLYYSCSYHIFLFR